MQLSDTVFGRCETFNRINSSFRKAVRAAQQMKETNHGFAQFAVSRSRSRCRTAGFRVEQNRSDHRFQIAAHVRAVVVEFGGDAPDVSGRRIASHQSLNQLARDERRDAFVVGDISDRGFQILLSGLSGRQSYTVEQNFAVVEWCSA